MNHNAPLDPIATFRGSFPTVATSARQIVSALEAPACGRRHVLDIAGVDTSKLANLLTGANGQQSQFAMSRAAQFERVVTDNGLAHVIALSRQHLGLDIHEIRQVDLSATHVREQHRLTDATAVDNRRLTLTRQRLRAMIDGADDVNLLRNALTQIDVRGQTAVLEHDVLALAAGGQLHLVVIRSFQAIDDRPDPSKVAAALGEAAVHLVSLQDTVAGLDAFPDVVSDDVLLVLPRNLSFTPTGRVYSATQKIRGLRRQLRYGQDAAAILAVASADAALPAMPARNAASPEIADAKQAAADAVSALPPAFGDPCVHCPMFRFCRDEAQRHGTVARLGTAVANSCGDVTTVADALDLAEGRRRPRTDAESALADNLTRAAFVERLFAAEA